MYKKLSITNTGYLIDVRQTPLECPYCHKSQIPEMQVAFLKEDGTYFILCACMNSNCKLVFNVSYNHGTRLFNQINQADLKKKDFNEEIELLSPSFCEIYNQAYSSEQMGLDQITGVGYRKALEFLIKDYLISLHPEKEEDIKKKLLSNCINDDVNDSHVKEVARRAIWLGNDETHYVRKWEDKDVSHLKTLIDLCLHWIESEIKTKKIIEEMPG
jgi:hypothetical protein